MSASGLSRRQWRQVIALTAVASLLVAGLRVGRAGTALSHLDFVAGGPGALEFCDPAQPRFLPVVARTSPIALGLATAAPAVTNQAVAAVLTLRTNTGKPIGDRDLLPTGADKLNLLLVDPDLGDFQVVHPAAGKRAGEWTFGFIPHRHGLYRLFADFTPAATDQEMYASVDLPVGGEERVRTIEPLRATAPDVFERAGLRLTLETASAAPRAREPGEWRLTVARLDRAPLSLRPVDGAAVRLVAFDQGRTGFVSLRPEASGSAQAGSTQRFAFKVTIPDPGRYVIWARVDAGSGEVVAPFSVEILP